jgi:hypothetical protein
MSLFKASALPVLAAGLVLGLVAANLRTVGAQDKQEKKDPLPGFQIPDLDKLLPQGVLDGEQMKMFRKAMDDLQKQLGQMQGPFGQFPGMPMLGGREPENRLGATLERPTAVLVEQLSLPEKNGIVVKSVKADGAAGKAGIRANDILLEVAGKEVPSEMGRFIKELNQIKKDEAIDVVVLRKGKRETVKGLKLGEVPAANEIFGAFGNGLKLPLPEFGKMPNLPNLPNLPIPGAPGGATQSFSMSKNGDGTFSAKYEKDNVTISIDGTLDGGKAKASAIRVRDGDSTTRYKTAEEVPEPYRENVRAILHAAETGNMSIPTPKRKDA